MNGYPKYLAFSQVLFFSLIFLFIFTIESPSSSDTANQENNCLNKSSQIDLPFNITIFNDKNDYFAKSKNISDENENELDGKWVIIQDWSQCSLACNGGKQFLQRVCIPPKTGGKPCEGEPVLERSCNNFSCPNVIKREIRLKKTRNPIIRVQRLSNRPLRYEVLLHILIFSF